MGLCFEQLTAACAQEAAAAAPVIRRDQIPMGLETSCPERLTDVPVARRSSDVTATHHLENCCIIGI